MNSIDLKNKEHVKLEKKKWWDDRIAIDEKKIRIFDQNSIHTCVKLSTIKKYIKKHVGRVTQIKIMDFGFKCTN